MSFFHYKRTHVSDLHQSLRCAMSSSVFVIGAERNMVTQQYPSLAYRSLQQAFASSVLKGETLWLKGIENVYITIYIL